MSSSESRFSPTYKNIKSKQKQSPQEIKEKIRKNYRDKIHSCRSLLVNNLRGAVAENELRSTLSNVYKNMFNYNDDFTFEEECEYVHQIEEEFLQEEIDWFMKQNEKLESRYTDWSGMDSNNDVICPVCEKTNLQMNITELSCSMCQWLLKTDRNLQEIKLLILNSVEKHGVTCNTKAEFTAVTEANEAHIYLICKTCLELYLVV